MVDSLVDLWGAGAILFSRTYAKGTFSRPSSTPLRAWLQQIQENLHKQKSEICVRPI
jgi:hypothetical protein